MNIQRIRCAGCGAPVPVKGMTAQVTHCRYCGQSLALSVPEGGLRRKLEQQVRLRKLRDRLDALDGAWERVGERPSEESSPNEISPNALASIGTVMIVFGIFCATAGSMLLMAGGFLLFGVGILCVVLGCARASGFEARKRRYETSRRKLLEAIDGETRELQLYA